MKFKYMLPVFLVTSLTSCVQNDFALKSEVVYFSTKVFSTLYEGEKSDLKEIEKIFKYYDAISDNYLDRDVKTIRSIGLEPINIDKEFYDYLKVAFTVKEEGANYFNPLCGSLSKKWKESLANKEVLDQTTIIQELNKMNNTTLIFGENNMVSKAGDAEIDLGGIAKGYALDVVHDYLVSKDIKSYLINAGFSSILLGQKKSDDGKFIIRLNEVDNTFIKLKDCVITTSGNSKQGVTIDGVTYSHIVNPLTGGAVHENDAVIVISSKGYLGDALSTSMMMESLDNIKQIEKDQDVKVIVVREGKIVYKNESLEVFNG